MHKPDFRSIGFTETAAQYPLSEQGQAIIAEHNGVPVEALPPAARYSSGPSMHEWIEALGRRKAAGDAYRHDSGRFLVPKELGL